MAEDEEYSIEEAIEVLNETIARKEKEIAKLEKKKNKKDSQELLDYLKADLVAYKSVQADMTEDDSILEGVDTESCGVVECPPEYEKYVESLSADDLENELAAEAIRSEYCDEIVGDICADIGKEVLSDKKMLKALLEDEYAVESIGEIIFYDDELYAKLSKIAGKKEKEKKKKSKKKD